MIAIGIIGLLITVLLVTIIHTIAECGRIVDDQMDETWSVPKK